MMNATLKEMDVEFSPFTYWHGGPGATLTGWTPRGYEWVKANTPEIRPYGARRYDAPCRVTARKMTSVVTTCIDHSDWTDLAIKARKAGMLVREYRPPPRKPKGKSA
jgi:hypothetical protein